MLAGISLSASPVRVAARDLARALDGIAGLAGSELQRGRAMFIE